MDIVRVNKAGKAIQKVLVDNTYGWPHKQALLKIERLADEALKFSDNDHYVSEKVAGVKEFAAILYSARKHKKHGGAEKVRGLVNAYAYRLTTWE
jgi:hypothetical protein